MSPSALIRPTNSWRDKRLLCNADAKAYMQQNSSARSWSTQHPLHNVIVFLTYPTNELMVVDFAILIHICLLQQDVHNMRGEELLI
mmetsp:Transcript_9158/g.21393  ORF Transcript_9158/g.21393 Transcript_9158/m.21393 type:complete len:86 (+) Transcript_9158:59-316(+)